MPLTPPSEEIPRAYRKSEQQELKPDYLKNSVTVDQMRTQSH